MSEPASTHCPIDGTADRPLEAGDQPRSSSFGLLYREHYAAIAGLIYRRTGHTQATEDLAADTFLAAYLALPRFRHDVPLYIWLRRIAHNRVNRWARREAGLRKALRLLPALESFLPKPPSLGERSPALRALLTLAPDHQAILSAHYLEGMPLAEAAQMLAISPEAAKSRLARAREALRRELAKDQHP